LAFFITICAASGSDGMEIKMGKKIAALVFDFGGVLMDWSPHYLYRQFFDADPVKIDRFLQEIGFDEWNRQFDQGCPFSEGIKRLIKRFPAYRELIRAYDERWEETLAGPIQPTVEILRQLKARAEQAKFSLYGLTNWSAEKFATIRHQYEFFNWFQIIVVSGEEQLVKPDPRIFRVLLQKSGRVASECLFVDDSAANITAAKNLGFETIHFQTPEQLRMELSQRGLLE
jgi:2-haloacid dehalogenase